MEKSITEWLSLIKDKELRDRALNAVVDHGSDLNKKVKRFEDCFVYMSFAQSRNGEQWMRINGGEEKVELLPEPKYKVGDVLMSCKKSEDTKGRGWLTDYGRFDTLQGMANTKTTIKDIVYNDVHQEYYYKGVGNMGLFAEYVLSLIPTTKPSIEEYKVGDYVIINGSSTGSGFSDNTLCKIEEKSLTQNPGCSGLMGDEPGIIIVRELIVAQLPRDYDLYRTLPKYIARKATQQEIDDYLASITPLVSKLEDSNEIKVGDIVVCLHNTPSSFYSIFKGGEGLLLKISRMDSTHYHTKDTPSSSEEGWLKEKFRKATPTEIDLYNKGVRNINDKPITKTIEFCKGDVVVAINGSGGGYTKDYFYTVRQDYIGGDLLTEMDSRGSTTNGWSKSQFRKALPDEIALFASGAKHLYDIVQNTLKFKPGDWVTVTETPKANHWILNDSSRTFQIKEDRGDYYTIEHSDNINGNTNTIRRCKFRAATQEEIANVQFPMKKEEFKVGDWIHQTAYYEIADTITQITEITEGHIGVLPKPSSSYKDNPCISSNEFHKIRRATQQEIEQAQLSIGIKMHKAILEPNTHYPVEDKASAQQCSTLYSLAKELCGEFKVGDYVYIINACSGAYGANDSIAKIIPQLTSGERRGISGDAPHICVELLNGAQWRISKNAKLRAVTYTEMNELGISFIKEPQGFMEQMKQATVHYWDGNPEAYEYLSYEPLKTVEKTPQCIEIMPKPKKKYNIQIEQQTPITITPKSKQKVKITVF